ASPTHYRILAELRGRAAHAGVRRGAGRGAVVAAAKAVAAMTLGRIDAETTANVGRIHGGTAIKVIPERCEIEAEVRSLAGEGAAALATALAEHLQGGDNAAECALDVNGEKMFSRSPTKTCAP